MVTAVVLDALGIAAGSLLVIATMYDLFQSVVLPRPAVGRVRFSPTAIRLAWRVWRSVAVRPQRLQLREAALAAFGPVTLLAMLLTWGFLLALGYALLFGGVSDQLHPQPHSFGTTLFFSIGTLLSFVVNGIDATGTAARFLVSVEAATGFGLFALVISLLFSLFGAFQRRESAVVALDALAGAPPTGVALLENCAKLQIPEQLSETFAEWRSWTVDVLESHLSYPLLMYFRSSHDNESWANSFVAVMDAASAVLSVVEGGPTGQAHLLHKIGAHLIEDMGRYYHRGVEPVEELDPEEFAAACTRLRQAGYRVRDSEAARQEFNRLRNVYVPWVERLSVVLAIPPAPWVGERRYLPHRDGGGALRP